MVEGRSSSVICLDSDDDQGLPASTVLPLAKVVSSPIDISDDDELDALDLAVGGRHHHDSLLRASLNSDCAGAPAQSSSSSAAPALAGLPSAQTKDDALELLLSDFISSVAITAQGSSCRDTSIAYVGYSDPGLHLSVQASTAT